MHPNEIVSREPLYGHPAFSPKFQGNAYVGDSYAMQSCCQFQIVLSPDLSLAPSSRIPDTLEPLKITVLTDSIVYPLGNTGLGGAGLRRSISATIRSRMTCDQLQCRRSASDFNHSKRSKSIPIRVACLFFKVIIILGVPT